LWRCSFGKGWWVVSVAWDEFEGEHDRALLQGRVAPDGHHGTCATQSATALAGVQEPSTPQEEVAVVKHPPTPSWLHHATNPGLTHDGGGTISAVDPAMRSQGLGSAQTKIIVTLLVVHCV
jgi:hypothetical protein